MKYLPLILVFLLSGFIQVRGQSFVFNPTDNYEATVDLDTYTNHKVFMTNQTGEELILGWTLLSKDIPDEWEALLCDFGGCYTGVPDSGIMAAISDTIQGYLRLTINPFNYVGTGTAVFKVYDNKHPTDADTLSFTIHAMDLTGISENEKAISLNIYPNPAHHMLSYSCNEEVRNKELRLINAQGETVLKQPAREKGMLDVSHLPEGLYFIRIDWDGVYSDAVKVLVR